MRVQPRLRGLRSVVVGHVRAVVLAVAIGVVLRVGGEGVAGVRRVLREREAAPLVRLRERRPVLLRVRLRAVVALRGAGGGRRWGWQTLAKKQLTLP